MPTSPTAPATLPPAPNPSVRATFSGLAYTWSVALPQLGTDLTALATNVYNNAVETNASAANSLAQANAASASALNASGSVASAAAQVQLALDAAAMKGNWSALTGALNKPASVANGGKIWALLNNLADVTTSQPGVTVDWVDITPAPSAYVCNHDQGLVALTSSSQHSLAGVVTLDALRALLIIQSPSNVHAVVYNNGTKLFGTAVLVRTGLPDLSGPKGILIATDKVLIASCPGTTAFETVVLSMTSSNIAVGTAVASTLPEACTPRDNFVAAGSSYVLALQGVSNARAIAITASGTTPAIGTSVVGFATGTGNPLMRSIDATRVLLVGATNTNALYAVPVTVSSGTTLTVGTVATSAGTTTCVLLAALSTGRWAAIYANTSTQGAIISVAGTVATLSVVALGAGASLNSAGVKVGDQIIVASEFNKVNTLTDVAGVATAGTAISAFINNLSSFSAPVAYGVDYAVFINSGTSNSSWSVIKIAGNNPYIFENGTSLVGGAACNGGPGLSGTPDYVLSISGKSAQVCQSNGSAGGTANSNFSIQFGSVPLRILLLPLVSTTFFKQSASVALSGSLSNASVNIRINRLELV